MIILRQMVNYHLVYGFQFQPFSWREPGADVWKKNYAVYTDAVVAAHWQKKKGKWRQENAEWKDYVTNQPTLQRTNQPI